MIKINSYLYLIIFPLMLFITGCLIKDSGGPYFLNYYDPSYVYLINSLNLLQLSSVGHFDHPGTTVQIMGAIILKLKFISEGSADEIIKNIFSDPEKYLELINRCFILLNSFTLLILGIFIYRITNDIYPALLLQLSPFVSFQILYGLVLVAPDNIIILPSLLLIGIIFYYIYKSGPDNPSLSFILFCGIVCGFGTVTKLTFIPMWIIPFILIKSFKNKSVFLISGVLTFLILFLPAISNYQKFIGWIYNLIFDTKIHGTMESQPFDITLYLSNIRTVFEQDKILLIIYLIMFMSIMTGIFFREKEIDNEQFKKSLKVLIAIFTGISAQILMITKNYVPWTQYYLIPSFILLISGLCISGSIIFEAFKNYFRHISLKHVYIFSSLIIILFAVLLIINTYKEATAFRDEAYIVRNIIKYDYQNELIIPSLMTANDECALAYMVFNDFGGSNNRKYTDLLAAQLRTEIYFLAQRDSFFTVPGNVNIEKTIRDNRKFIVQFNSITAPLDNFISFLKKRYNIDCISNKEIITNKNGESIYEIVIK